MSNVKITIRDAKRPDITAIHHILTVSFREYHTLLGIKIPALTETTDDIIHEMKHKTVLVSTVNHMLLSGTIRYEIIGDVGYISRFGVLPNWQSGGSGGQLLRHVEESCKRAGVKALALHTATTLSKPMRYYYGQGFFVHSTTHDRGYIRGLLVKELTSDTNYDIDSVIKLKS